VIAQIFSNCNFLRVCERASFYVLRVRKILQIRERAIFYVFNAQFFANWPCFASFASFLPPFLGSPIRAREEFPKKTVRNEANEASKKLRV